MVVSDLYFFNYVFIYFRENGEESEKERETNMMWKRSIDLLPLSCPQLGNLACHPGLCPDRESNQGPFGLQDNTQPTEPHPSEQSLTFKPLLKVSAKPLIKPSFHCKELQFNDEKHFSAQTKYIILGETKRSKDHTSKLFLEEKRELL